MLPCPAIRVGYSLIVVIQWWQYSGRAITLYLILDT